MNSKIIFFDIDGTILSHRTLTISDHTRKAIRQAQENGHLTFINTGRTIGEIDPMIIELGFDGYICGCGTYISYHDSILHQVTIPQKTIHELINDFRSYQLEAILEGTNAIYYDNHISNRVVQKIKDEHSVNFNVQTWDAPDISADKFCIWSKASENFPKFYEKYKDRFDFIIRGRNFAEVVPKGYSKATGILLLLEHLKLSLEDTFAIGDSANDLAMLQCVNTSIAMGNSSDELKALVSYVTKDVDEDGVYYAMKEYGLI